MEICSYTDIGKKRKSNQDFVGGIVIDKYKAFAVVCDGMGGTNGGDIASQCAVETVNQFLKNKFTSGLKCAQIKQIIMDAVKEANEAVYMKSEDDVELQGMGTTIVLSVVYDNILHLAFAGDSRCYLISNNEIMQISNDHSVVQELVDSGEITIEEAKRHPQKNIITRALGVKNSIKVDYKKIAVKEGDIILMCTDGLTNHVDDQTMCNICLENDINVASKKLVDEANTNGGSDNITVALLAI